MPAFTACKFFMVCLKAMIHVASAIFRAGLLCLTVCKLNMIIIKLFFLYEIVFVVV